MREIKFRYWDELHKTMMNWSGLKQQKHIEFLENAEPQIMQYTGLKDKNGKEIYEGDIFTDHSLVGIHPNMQRFVGEIIFKNAAFRFGRSNCDCGDCENSLISEETDLEIIGNIYENPELLK